MAEYRAAAWCLSNLCLVQPRLSLPCIQGIRGFAKCEFLICSCHFQHLLFKHAMINFFRNATRIICKGCCRKCGIQERGYIGGGKCWVEMQLGFSGINGWLYVKCVMPLSIFRALNQNQDQLPAAVKLFRGINFCWKEGEAARCWLLIHFMERAEEIRNMRMKNEYTLSRPQEDTCRCPQVVYRDQRTGRLYIQGERYPSVPSSRVS